MAKSKTRHKSKKLLKTIAALVILVLVFVVLQLTRTTHFFSKSLPPSKAIVKVGTPTPAPNADVSGTQPTTNQKISTSTNSSPGGGAIDTNGQAGAETSPSQWTTSQSGAITVKQPIANGTLQTGDVLSGSATVSQVSFTLIDNDVGVIAQGTLNVINGNFSGTLQFMPKASSGRLDVYSTNSLGVEYNQVQISVNF
ncbi:MAG TPA: hypothetical protein VMR34_00585 [Candidatus Saccharimonadales bacterium]|nr:hypothetical protein [Candidatus Saccharimonadales bacterium]